MTSCQAGIVCSNRMLFHCFSLGFVWQFWGWRNAGTASRCPGAPWGFSWTTLSCGWRSHWTSYANSWFTIEIWRDVEFIWPCFKMSYKQKLGQWRVVFEASLLLEIELGLGTWEYTLQKTITFAYTPNCGFYTLKHDGVSWVTSPFF